MSLSYLLTLTLFSFLKCSEAQKAFPGCRALGSFTPTIQCSNLDSPDVLRDTLNDFMNRTGSSVVRDVQITNSNFLNLPHDLFQGLKLQQFMLQGASVMSLSDSDTAFEGLENSLHFLLLYNCSILNGIDWYQLRNLRALRDFTASNIGLQYVDDEINLIAGLNLTILALLKDKISYIGDNAFAPFLQLESLILSYNQISDLKRNMFPNPGNRLREIDLSNNKISSLPSDFFTNMPSLISVVLAENEFLTLDQALFAPIWKNLNKIDVGGNALRCDCRLKWLLEQRFPRNTWGTCDEPQAIRGKDIKDLVESELWCF